jgi:hypothetical protein
MTRKYVEAGRRYKNEYHSKMDVCKKKWSGHPSEYKIHLETITNATYMALGLLGSCYAIMGGNYALRLSVLNLILALRVNHDDPWHYCEKIPFLFIRLHQDHLAYDFIKSKILYIKELNWKLGTLGRKGNLTKDQKLHKAMKAVPFLRYWQNDLTEDILDFDAEATQLSLIVAYFLVKLRMLITLRNEERMEVLLCAISQNVTTTPGALTAPAITKLSPLVQDPEKKVLRLMKRFLLGEPTNYLRQHRFVDSRPLTDLQQQLTQIVDLGIQRHPSVWHEVLQLEKVANMPASEQPKQYLPRTYEECFFVVLHGSAAFFENEEIQSYLVEICTAFGRDADRMRLKFSHGMEEAFTAGLNRADDYLIQMLSNLHHV